MEEQLAKQQETVETLQKQADEQQTLKSLEVECAKLQKEQGAFAHLSAHLVQPFPI